MKCRWRKGIFLAAMVLCLNGCGNRTDTAAVPQRGESESRDMLQAEKGQASGTVTEAEYLEEAGFAAMTDRAETEDKDKAETAAETADIGAGNGEKAEAAAETEALEEELPPLQLTSEDWGLGFGEAGTQPVGNEAVSVLKAYDAYYMGNEKDKVIYLTFDCGYENGNTEPVLDALKKHKAPATFFVVGHFLETAPELVKRMAAEGHAAGNHTYHHPDMASISEVSDFRKELEDVEVLYREITGKELDRYYRPPAGKCTEVNLKMARELGYSTIFWSLAYVDWKQDDQPGHEEALQKLTERIHPGAVVLLHNTSKTNGEILDELLSRWEEMGYEFRPLSELVRQ